MKKNAAVVLLLCFVLFLVAPAGAVIVPLGAITSNGVYVDDMNVNVDVVEVLPGHVDFTVFNQNAFDSSVARIYFDADASVLASLAGTTAGPGTVFSQGASPANPAGADTLDPIFVTTGDLSFGADPPPSQNGIEPGEWFTVSFSLTAGATLVDVLDELDSGVIRIAAHVIALPDGSSETVVTPEPSTLLLTGLALVFLSDRRRTH